MHYLIYKMENLPRPFPEDQIVSSLQLLCASLIDIKSLHLLNLDHLYLPPSNYEIPDELLILPDDKIVMSYEHYIYLKKYYCDY